MKNPRHAYLLEPPPQPLPAGLAFLRHARFRLREDYLQKIEAALEPLHEEQLWWRPNEAGNSIGNLLLHLTGNLRQWISAGVGGAPDLRDRPAEFAARGARGKADLLALLRDAVEEADARLAALERDLLAAESDAPLQRECRPQGFPQTVLDAVFHPVEHFSYHTGQIVYIAKLFHADGIRLYDDRLLADDA